MLLIFQIVFSVPVISQIESIGDGWAGGDGWSEGDGWVEGGWGEVGAVKKLKAG